MSTHVITKGLDIPITGEPAQRVDAAASSRRVALAAADYVGLKATFLVREGDLVRRGQPLFEDKRNPGVLHTAPGAGRVAAIVRGERRALISVIIELSDTEAGGTPADSDYHPFAAWKGSAPADREQGKELLLESGLWTALRERPFGKTPAPGTIPAALFVTASDSNPLAPDMDVVAAGRQEDLDAGLAAVARLTDGPVYFCRKAGSKLAPSKAVDRASVEDFKGPHPSGTAGVHINRLAPVSRNRVVWTIGLQDVLSVGFLFRTGRLDVTRIISLAGPSVMRPRLLKTRLGASLDDLVRGELAAGEHRVISGSVLSGRRAMGPEEGWLGRFTNQVSVLREDRTREFMGWLAPGARKYSSVRLFLSKLSPGRKFEMTTSTNGDRRAMVPVGLFERVMPMDILPTFLLRAILMNDTERAEQLGCLELDEEDLALCSFVSPGKDDFGPVLRRNLDLIEKEG